MASTHGQVAFELAGEAESALLTSVTEALMYDKPEESGGDGGDGGSSGSDSDDAR